MAIFFTSDTHYGHTNILKYCNRPFDNITHMNDALISNWNEVVRPNDIVYHLGDFAMMRDPDSILRRLNGKEIHLILGNHDAKNKRILRDSRELASVRDVAEVRVGPHTFWLSHYAHLRWPKAHYGAIHLFGHSHGGLQGVGKSMDVGVDPMGYYPISMDDVIDKMNKLQPVEHHGED